MMPRVDLIENIEFRKKIPKAQRKQTIYHPYGDELDG